MKGERKAFLGLSPRQLACLRAVHAHLAAEGRVPPVDRLARDMGGLARSAVSFGHGHLGALLRKGWVARDDRPGAVRAGAWRLAGISWAWMQDGQGAVRRVPYCDPASPQGRRLALALAAAPHPRRKGKASRRMKAALARRLAPGQGAA